MFTMTDSKANSILNIGLHMIILFTFLVVFFFEYISNVSKKTIDDSINDLIKDNTNDLLMKLDKISDDINKDTGSKLDWSQIKDIATTLETEYDEELPDITSHNKKLYNTAIICIVLFTVLLFGFGIYMSHKGFKINWKFIIIENFIIFVMIGIIEYLFFVNIAFKYIPVDPSNITNSLLDSLKKNIQ